MKSAEIKQLMLEVGVTQTEVARRLGVVCRSIIGCTNY